MLPTPQQFLAGAAESVGARAGAAVGVAKPIPQPAGGISAEFRRLLVHYGASQLGATSTSEIGWGPLARQLGTRVDFIAEAAATADSDGALWMSILEERIKRTGSMKLFRDADWEKLESSALQKLLYLAEKNLIRDVGELLAIARAARMATESRVPSHASGGQNVNINFNGGGSMGESGELPGVGAKMTIDLSPRSAQTLTEPGAKPTEHRVIDSEMLTATELREFLTVQKQPQPEQIEVESQPVETAQAAE